MFDGITEWVLRASVFAVRGMADAVAWNPGSYETGSEFWKSLESFEIKGEKR
jgi:hypothetical protein